MTLGVKKSDSFDTTRGITVYELFHYAYVCFHPVTVCVGSQEKPIPFTHVIVEFT